MRYYAQPRKERDAPAIGRAGGMDRTRTCDHGFAGRRSSSELPSHVPGIRRAGKEERKKTTSRQGHAGWWDRPESN